MPSGPRVTMLVRNPYTHDSRVEREAASLTGAGYRVTVVAEARPGLPSRERRDGVTVIRVPRPPVRIPGLRFAAYLLRLDSILARTRPDILHAHDTDALQSVGPAAGRLGVPFVYDAHELWLELGPRGHSPSYYRVSRAYYAAIERRYVPRAAGVIVANPPVAPELARRYGRADVRVVANYPTEVGPVERRELRDLPGGRDIPREAPVVLYAGGLVIERGIEQLVEAMTMVPSAHLAFLGGGSLEPELHALVDRLGLADRTHFLGMVPTDQVVAYCASATVGMLTTEPVSVNNVLALPNKIFQYMAAGIPVIASDYPQIREVLESSGAGRVMDPTQPAAIADAINAVLADPAAAREAGARGAEAVRDRYNWSVSEETLLDVYGSLRK